MKKQSGPFWDRFLFNPIEGRHQIFSFVIGRRFIYSVRKQKGESV